MDALLMPREFVVIVSGFDGDPIYPGPRYHTLTRAQARWRAWRDFREAGYGRNMTFREFLDMSRVKLWSKAMTNELGVQ